MAPREAWVRDKQPYLHELVTVVAAPGLALSDADGQLTGDRCHRGLPGRPPGARPGSSSAWTGGSPRRSAASRWTRGPPGSSASYAISATPARTRPCSSSAPARSRPDGLRETIRLVSRAREPLTCTVNLELDADLADIGEVKAGRPTAMPPFRPDLETAGTVRWPVADGIAVIATLSPEPDETRAAAPSRVLAAWDVALPARGRWEATVEVTATAPGGPPVAAPPTRELWRAPAVSAGDHRLPALVERSVADLAGLLAADPAATDDHYLTAGAPWYLTLFGRDSLWAARMALPLGTDLAAGTLRTLARRQGTRIDPGTEEEPGKILHEVRASARPGAERYYGTVDATPLWISLLHDAWRWGLADAEVAALLPNLEAALGWLRDAAGRTASSATSTTPAGCPTRAGRTRRLHPVLRRPARRRRRSRCARCRRTRSRRRWRAPRCWTRSAGPAATAGGTGPPALRDRFRTAFWVDDRPGAIRRSRWTAPAGRSTRSPPTSATCSAPGCWTRPRRAAVVRRLAAPDMDSGFGLRTMSSRSAGFNPLSYHGGSVWSHDTAIALRGLAAAGTADAARGRGQPGPRACCAAAPAFDFRLPELYGGESAGAAGGRWPTRPRAGRRPGRPQRRWSCSPRPLGLTPDVPAGRVTLRPMRPSPVGELTVRGLRVAGQPLDVRLTAAGDPEILTAPPGLAVDLG